MKRQKDFDWFKFVTTAMFVIGIGGILFSLFLLSPFYKAEELDLEWLEERHEPDGLPIRVPSPSAFKAPLNKLPNEHFSKKEVETFASLDVLEYERLPHLDLELENLLRTVEVNGEAADDKPNEKSESGYVSETNTNSEEAEAVLIEIHEAASRFRQILVRKRDLSLGLEHLYPEAIHDPKSITREYFEAKAAFRPLFGAYMRAAEWDLDAFNSGGAIYQALSGLADVSADPEARRISTTFYTKLPE